MADYEQHVGSAVFAPLPWTEQSVCLLVPEDEKPVLPSGYEYFVSADSIYGIVGDFEENPSPRQRLSVLIENALESKAKVDAAFQDESKLDALVADLLQEAEQVTRQCAALFDVKSESKTDD